MFSNKKFLFLLTYRYFSSKFRYISRKNTKKRRHNLRHTKGDIMKKVTLLFWSVLLLALCACAAGAPENLTDALTADSWKAELSEGTSAVYTFAADGTFRFAVNKRQILFGAVFPNAAVNARSCKSFCGAHAAFNRDEIHNDSFFLY